MANKVGVSIIGGVDEIFEGDIQVCHYSDGWIELYDGDECVFIIHESKLNFIKEIRE